MREAALGGGGDALKEASEGEGGEGNDESREEEWLLGHF